MKISKFGRKITGTSGIGQLMDDLGGALSAGVKTIADEVKRAYDVAC